MVSSFCEAADWSSLIRLISPLFAGMSPHQVPLVTVLSFLFYYCFCHYYVFDIFLSISVAFPISFFVRTLRQAFFCVMPDLVCYTAWVGHWKTCQLKLAVCVNRFRRWFWKMPDLSFLPSCHPVSLHSWKLAGIVLPCSRFLPVFRPLQNMNYNCVLELYCLVKPLRPSSYQAKESSCTPFISRCNINILIGRGVGLFFTFLYFIVSWQFKM